MTIIALDFVTRRIATLDGSSDGAPGSIFTSKLYPVLFEDSLDTTGAAQGGTMYPFDDQMDVSATMLEGELRTVLLFGYFGPDEVDVSADMLDGELRTVLLTGYFGPDELDMTAAMLEGSLVDKLISYSNWTPDNLDVTAAMLDGTLVTME